MIKVVHIITDLDTGGAETMLYKLLDNMDRSRFESIVISLMDQGTLGKQIEALGIPVHVLGMTNRKLSFSALCRLSNFVRKFRPNLIQGWMYHGNIAASISRFFYLKKVPVLWNIRHSLYNLEYEKKRTAIIIRFAAIISKSAVKIIYNAQKSAVQHEKIGYAEDRTIVIPNGFDCARLKPSSARRLSMRKELTIGQNDIVIGFIGRYHPMKDHENFFEAAGILAKKYDNVYYVLAGTGVEESNNKITEMIMQNRIKNKVHLLGERRDIPELNAAMDIACLPSSYGEAFPNIIGEAMSSGIPCVVTDVGDSAWIVGETGKVVPPRNAKALANAWEYLIEAGREERRRLGNNARQRILKNFALDQIIQKYETLYEGINNNALR